MQFIESKYEYLEAVSVYFTFITSEKMYSMKYYVFCDGKQVFDAEIMIPVNLESSISYYLSASLYK